MSYKKAHVMWKRFLAGVLAAILVLGWNPTTGGFGDMAKVHAAEADNSIINWGGLPQITEVKVQAETESGVGIEFTHPGIFAGKENLDLMREMIHQGYDPWFSSFEAFRESSLASKEYVNTNRDRTHTYIGNADRQDANAAYAQSIMWWVTGDKGHYDIAADIVRSYCESYDPEKFRTEQDGGYGWSADIITAGMVINKLSFAAEILRYAQTQVPYENAWTQADTEGFTEVLKMAYPLYDRTDKWMNQTAFTFQAMTASAVFQNDADLYETAIERATVNDKAAWHFADASIKWQARLVDTTVTVEDFNDGDTTLTLIHPEEPVIQWAEMGRDQPHALAGLSIISSIAQTASVQGTRVDENGGIRDDGSGTDLFGFLDHRLLKGANYYYRFNLGYDVPWYPLAKGNTSRYEDCPAYIGGNNEPGWWPSISHAGRFTLGGSGVLYYHYLYEEKLDKNHPDFKYVAQAQELTGDAGIDGDTITNASMLIAPAQAKTGEPQGPPMKKEKPGYEANTAGTGRIQAMSHSGAYAGRMPDTSKVSSEYYTDEVGTRAVINNTYKDDYLWFRDVNLGEDPLKTFMLTAASNSEQGTLFKVILLDDVEVKDWNAVTREEIDSGEVIAEGYSGGTGWWSTYQTRLFEMARPLSGTHSFAFLFLGSSNVYNLAANVDWMAFGNYYAYQDNAVKDAPLQKNVGTEGGYVVLQDGSVFGWDSMNMDIGSSALSMNIASTGTGSLTLYRGTPEGSNEKIAVYDIPFTGGKEMTVDISGEHLSVIKGNNDIYYVYEGKDKLLISSIRSYYHKEDQIPAVQGEDYSFIKSGTVENKTEDETSYAQLQDGAVAFYRLNLSKDSIAFRVRTNGKVLFTLVSDMDNGADMSAEEAFGRFGILQMEIPDTKGKWAQFQYDMSNVSNRSSNVYLMVTGGNADLDYIAFGLENTPPEIVSYSYDKPVFSAEKDGLATDYILAGEEYGLTVETFDFDNDPVQVMLTLDQDYAGEDGSFRFSIAKPGVAEGLIIADDGNTWTLQNLNVHVFSDINSLIEAVGAYDKTQTYSRPSLAVYEKALALAGELGKSGYTQELKEALEGLSAAAAGLVMLIPSEEDGSIDYIKYAEHLKFSRFSNLDGGFSEDQEAILNNIQLLADNNQDTFIEWRHAQHNSPAYFMIDFQDGMGVKLREFTLQSRQGFGSRTGGVLLEASNDGESWTAISSKGAANTNDLQTIGIKSEYQDIPYRYIRLYNPRVGESGANSFLSIAEFHLFGQVVEMEPILSFRMDGIRFVQQKGTNLFTAQMGEAMYEASGRIPEFTLVNGAKLFQGETELVSGVSPVVFDGEETGNGAKRTAVLTARTADGEEQEYLFEVTFQTVALEEPGNLSWSGTNAGFEASGSGERVMGYEISLYRGGELVPGSLRNISLNEAGRYSFYYGPFMEEAGDYTFAVIAKADPEDSNFGDSIPAVSPVRAYAPADITKGRLIASFDFEGMEAGEIAGGGAKAAVMGTAAYEDSYEGSGRAARINSNFWLNVTKEDGSPLLAGMNEIVISYDNKFDNNGNVGWTFYAAPNTGSQAGRYEKYMGILDRSAGLVVERYFLNNQGRPSNPTRTGIADQWKHVDVVVSLNETRLYIDGELAASAGSSALLSDILTEEGGILQIGKANWGKGEYYNGLMDNFQIYCNDGTEADNAAIKAAQTAVKEAFAQASVSQNDAGTEEEARTAAEAVVDSIELDGVEAKVVTAADKFVPATAGNSDVPEGVDGRYFFTVELSRGYGTPVTTEELSLAITAAPYDSTEDDNAAIAAAAEAVREAFIQASVSQNDAGTEEEARAAAEAVVNGLELDGVEAKVLTAEGKFVPAAGGTAENPEGTDGSYAFTVELGRGNGIPVTTEILTVRIIARKYVHEDPDGPDQPDVPDNPDQPDVPDVPDNPGQPDVPDNPDQPDVPGGAQEDAPAEVYEPEADWPMIYSRLMDAVSKGGAEGFVNNELTGKTIEVPAYILRELRGADGTLAMHTGTGIAFSISGRDITDELPGDTIRLSVDQTQGSIPAGLLAEKLADASFGRQIVMESRGALGMTVNLHLQLGSENAQKYANLYRYHNETGCLEYLGSFLITENGQAMFALTEGGNLLVTVTGRKPREASAGQNAPDASCGQKYDTAVRGDTLSAVAARNKMPLSRLLTLNPR